MFGFSEKEKATKKAKKNQQLREEILKPEHYQWLSTVINNNIIGGRFDQAVAQRAAKMIEEGQLDALVVPRNKAINKERQALRTQTRRNKRK